MILWDYLGCVSRRRSFFVPDCLLVLGYVDRQRGVQVNVLKAQLRHKQSDLLRIVD